MRPGAPPQGARNPGKGGPTPHFLWHRPHPARRCPGQATSSSGRPAGLGKDGGPGWTDSGQTPSDSPFWQLWSWGWLRPSPVRPWRERVGRGAPAWCQAADPALLPHTAVQRKPRPAGLGAMLAFLFLIFILTVVYAVWCSESRSRQAPDASDRSCCQSCGPC